ncbi:oxoglutarate dehydrogenase (succinyl-transferring), E1 component [Orientia chuto str. Dubai]|uniref:2-oxoglutarate dehydrogenase E1 component n=1 Tax=Orientia chuto str. Dubai TaxID=1359168 RepID=A0A0F3MPA0_9RICK|nr:2-oxoglutarate dehydrogenase E1 component [Candidatus Orientia mediorientalis]KJV57501.1 oxoglutarate dehydrogenase (succinyl-transferring), E1 component [Orientia chuto str. Dubai]
MISDDFLFIQNAEYIEYLHQKYIKDPFSVDNSWITFFQKYNEYKYPIINKPNFSNLGLATDDFVEANISPSESHHNKYLIQLRQFQTQKLIAAYRANGHLCAKLDPLGLQKPKTKEQAQLSLNYFGLSEFDLDENFCFSLPNNFVKVSNFRTLINYLEQIYCNNIAVEFNHITDQNEIDWLYNQLEQISLDLDNIDRNLLLKNLISITGFEEFLHTKFVGAKRFSSQGAETAVAAIIAAIEQAISYGLKEVVIGMAHRGRLVTLAEVAKKPHYAIIAEFINDVHIKEKGLSGDVKYHMGYSGIYTGKNNNNIRISLTSNPSHLEAVNSIVAGQVRAKQDVFNDITRKNFMGILIHGDAAFSGQGVVAESLLLSALKSYSAGGILHYIISNQIGFTANIDEIYPGQYTTEVAKTIKAPIFHVNGDDPESVLKVTSIAMAYRQKFAKDVVIDIICYRKYGHNEGDEPMFTQATMYNVIKNKVSVTELYAQKLIDQKFILESDYKDIRNKFKNFLNEQFEIAKTCQPILPSNYNNNTYQTICSKESENILTGVEGDTLLALNEKLCTIPSEFIIHSRLKKLLSDRLNKVALNEQIDWATAEQLAFASLLIEKIPIRLTGQDAIRGTFSHRHAVLYSQLNQSNYIPLNNLSSDQAYLQIANSPLSEYAVLGFEYGYSLVNSKQLVIWEAQFGDFANGAQIVFDQFISSAETKWQMQSNIVLLLPHGYEGQGPEHSSARIERYLQLAVNNNILVVYPTTPASFFHLLRRQIISTDSKPLIVMSPKSLLRHKLVVSKLADLGPRNYFQLVIDEVDTLAKGKIKRIIICSGKLFYELYDFRSKHKITDVAIIRIEQYFPFPTKLLSAILAKYSAYNEIIWCQEEPQNMGAWTFIKPYLEDIIDKAKKLVKLKYIGRDQAAAPAVGYNNLHNQQQQELIRCAFNIGENL